MASDWNSGSCSGLVDIGTHRLHAKISGPPRKPDDPVVIIMHGFSSTMLEWPVAFRMIADQYRVLDYDRSGYGESEVAASEPTGETIAQELGALLRTMRIRPPYVTVAHSWGGITSLEFLATCAAGDLAGMVFVDANTPRYFETVPMLWKQDFVNAVSGDLDFLEVTGLRKETILSEKEWAAFVAEDGSEKHRKQHSRESAIMDASFDAVIAKELLERKPPILGTAPVAVLRGRTERDQERMYQAGLMQGKGTALEQHQYRAMLRTWEETDVLAQKEFFRLTAGKTTLIQATKSGHNVPLTEPELIVKAVQWVIEHQQ